MYRYQKSHNLSQVNGILGLDQFTALWHDTYVYLCHSSEKLSYKEKFVNAPFLVEKILKYDIVDIFCVLRY